MRSPPAFPEDGISGIVFDLDGTLVDSYAAIAASVNHARRSFGLPQLSPSEVRRQVGRGLEHLMEEVVGPERAEEGVRLFREEYARVWAEGTVPLPGAVEVVRGLRRRGYRLSVASNKPARFSEPILARVGMEGCFDAIEGPDRAGVTKPHPGMIERCLRAMGVGAKEAVYVGDMVLDVETAARAGVAVLLVPGGSSPAEELAASGQMVLPSLGELLRLMPGSRSERANRGDAP